MERPTSETATERIATNDQQQIRRIFAGHLQSQIAAVGAGRMR